MNYSLRSSLHGVNIANGRGGELIQGTDTVGTITEGDVNRLDMSEDETGLDWV